MNKDKINFGNDREEAAVENEHIETQDEAVNREAQLEQNTEQDVNVVEPEFSNEPEIIADDELLPQQEMEDKLAVLEAALYASEEKVRGQQDEVLRARADVENMRRRTEQEIDKARKFALERFATELLPVIDNLERAIELADKENEALKPMLEGVELTLKTMQGTVDKFGLKEINPQGEAFDPTFHQAMSIQESADFAPNTVMMVMQKGYELNGRVIRPAMVMVSKAAAGNVNETV